jgi:hypothetical protein
MSHLFQVLYSSTIQGLDHQKLIEEILLQSRKNNKKNDLSGILLFRNGDFLQLLEGDKINVYHTLKKIRDDNRHKGMKILFEGEIQKRVFEGWQMAFKSDKDDTLELQSKVQELISSRGISSNLDLINTLNHFYFTRVR